MATIQGPEARRVFLFIRGRVQGVYYRGSMQREARHAGVTGWVRNTPAGDVEAEVEGAPGAVEAVVGWCWRGPTFARVDSVDVIEQEPRGEEEGFSIRG